jgi:hypothetical protein
MSSGRAPRPTPWPNNTTSTLNSHSHTSRKSSLFVIVDPKSPQRLCRRTRTLQPSLSVAGPMAAESISPGRSHLEQSETARRNSPSPGPRVMGSVTGSQNQARASSGSLSHRSSFAENRSAPQSPRLRHSSISQASTPAAVLDLLNNPPTTGAVDERFMGRDWREIKLGEVLSCATIVEPAKVDDSTAVEEVTKVGHLFSVQRSLRLSLFRYSSSLRN